MTAPFLENDKGSYLAIPVGAIRVNLVGHG